MCPPGTAANDTASSLPMTEVDMSIASPRKTAACLTLTGRVQGIGLRPAIARFAATLSLAGDVRNTREGVKIHVEGEASSVQQFVHELPANLPPSAEIHSLRSEPVQAMGAIEFLVEVVRNSSVDDAGASRTNQSLSTRVPADVVACKSCLAEVRSDSNHRHSYPFTSCTDCGPRYSIIERMPYEREHTSMAAFPLCERCRREYTSPEDRRFHAQTIACPQCGPQLWLRDSADRVIAREEHALRAAAAAILSGRIVALRGLGGYQLLVDATSPEAVARLREGKQRPAKPLAVMVASLSEAEKLARIDRAERCLLEGPAGPIVLVRQRTESRLAASVTAGLSNVGLMLPTTSLHVLLLDKVKRPMVCTSGNIEGEPLAYRAEQAVQQLRGLADLWLEHDLSIQRPIDDSVVRVMANRPVAVRLARGFAPLPLALDTPDRLVTLGGHQKTSLAVSNGTQAVLGPHIGDLDTIAARERYLAQIGEFSSLYGIENCPFVCDQHPQYFTTQWAADQPHSAIQVQHHHAHIVAGMLEHGWLDRQVLGVSFDGTGFGTDETIWGGEFLLATASGFERVGCLLPFQLVGGEFAVREPWRVATALVHDAAGDEVAARLPFREGNPRSLLPLLKNTRLPFTTTSAGRLFDGVAALALGIERNTFEGQAAMLLENACDLSATGEYQATIQPGQKKVLDWRPLLRQLLREVAVGVPPGVVAMRFHRGLARAIHELCAFFPGLPVVLGGGVFQNRVLVELLAKKFADAHRPLGLPGLIPTNDGGLAAGQLAIAASLAIGKETG